ncbi:hypothetical protein [Laceyella putida]|uniref:Band 7 domain-containing protein n=1 Tax=Laceyella putida TaxID=110101 RepID=A0ABW2RJJ2_9BACL
MVIIKQVEPVKFSLFSKEPISSNTLAYVYKNTQGEYRLVQDGEQLTRAELRAKNYTLRFEVARQTFDYKHEREYQSKDPGKSFGVTLQMSVSVKDPVAVVQNEINDLQSYLDRNMPYWIQPLVAEYGVQDFKEVRTVIQQIDQRSEIRSNLESRGLTVNQVLAHVRLSEEDWEHYKKMEDLKKQYEYAKLEQEKKRELEKQQQEYALEDQELKKKIEAEEKAKLLEALQKHGLYGGIVEGASKQQLMGLLFKELDDLKSLQKEAVERILQSPNADIDDIMNTMKLVGMRDLTQQSEQPLQLEQAKEKPVDAEWDGLDELLEEEMEEERDQ